MTHDKLTALRAPDGHVRVWNPTRRLYSHEHVHCQDRAVATYATDDTLIDPDGRQRVFDGSNFVVTTP